MATNEKPAEHGLGVWLPKAWGRMRTIYRDAQIEIVECEIRAGGYSSEHCHHRKHNRFMVVSGLLRLRRNANGAGWLIPAGGMDIFHANDRHQFEAATDVRLIEIYTSADGSPVDPDDIERFTSGGVRE